MADLKLVGAVAIKVRPDASGFRTSTQAQVSKELKGVEAEVKVKAKGDTTELKSDVAKAKKEIEAQEFDLRVGLDHDSVRRAQLALDKAVKGLGDHLIHVKLDADGILQAQRDIDNMKKKAHVEMTITPDEQGARQVLAKIAEIRRQKLEKLIHFGTSEKSLAAAEAKAHAILQDAAHIELTVGNDRGSIEKAIARLKAELVNLTVPIDVKLNKKDLNDKITDLTDRLAHTPVEMRVNYNDQKSLQATRERLLGMLSEVNSVPLDVLVNETDIKEKLARIDALIKASHTVVDIKTGLDHDSIVRAMEQLDAAIKDHKTVNIKVDLDDPSDVAAKIAELTKNRDNSKVHITFSQDEAGYREVLAKIDAIRREKIVKSIKFDVDENSATGLAATEAKIKALLARSSAKILLEYDMNLKGLAEARLKLRALLGFATPKIVIDTRLDETALLAQLAAMDRVLAAEEARKRRIKFEADLGSLAKAALAIKLLTRNQHVTVFVHIRDNFLLAAAKLTGLRAATRWTQEFGRALGTLDRNLPIVAAITLALSALSAGVITLIGDIFSLGNGLGQVLRMGALLAPALVSGLGAMLIVLTGVFKDFGAAVNGDEKAIAKLSDSGKKAAAEVRVSFQAIRETISQNFWEKAGDSMLNFVRTALPQVGDGLAKLSSSMGNAFGTVLDSFSNLANNDGFKVFFGNLSRGFDIAGPGISNFFDAFNKLSIIGSTIFPRLGRAFNDMSAKFIAWVDKVAGDGSLARWIDVGVEGMKNLWHIAVELVHVWGNIGQAATAAGTATLGSFSAAMDKLDEITRGARFQRNMRTIFEGAHDASEAFHKSLGDLGPAMDVFSKTIATTLTGSGKALGAFIRDLGDVMSSPRVSDGMTAFTDGLTNMFVALRPAAGAVADILGTFGSILGKVATDSGPLFRDLFLNLANVLDAAWRALEPFLPALIGIGQTVINTLGPVFMQLAQTIIPAFASGITNIGDGIQPVLALMGFFATQAAKMVASMNIADVLGIATVILTLGGSMKIAATAVPILVAALNLLRPAIQLTAVSTALLVPGIGLLLAVLTGAAVAGITAFATSQHNAAPFAGEYAAALDEDAKAAGRFGDAIGDATKKVALKKLADSTAADDAATLGIGLDEVANALLKGGDAWTNLKKKTDDASGALDKGNALAFAAAVAGSDLDVANNKVSDSTEKRGEAAKRLNGILDDNKNSMDADINRHKLYDKFLEIAGIKTDAVTDATGKGAVAQETLRDRIDKTVNSLGAASAASATLQDAFAGSASKIDAMRKSFEILLGPNVKQKVADATGAYVKSFNDITESAKAVRPEIEKLGDSAFGADGFLNVASGNAAVLQVNQALIDQVNNTWAAAKVIYDNTLRETGNAQEAFQKADEFIKNHHGDFNALAEASGVSADQVQGQWDAVFNHDWVLKVTLSGATAAAAAAEAIVTTLKGKWDGQKFMADFDANPTLALLAMKDPFAAAELWVDTNWAATFDALPDKAKEVLRNLTNTTEEDWSKHDFFAILQVAEKIPGLAEALLQIRNGVDADWTAIIFAATNKLSVEEARRELNGLQERRTAYIDVIIRRSELPDLNGDASGSGRPGIANGGIFRTVQKLGDLFTGKFQAKYYANGGIEQHVAQITKPGGPTRIWAEPETQGEAYVPYAMSKRPRSVAILTQVARDFGFQLTKATKFSDGGITAGRSSTTSADVHIGSLYTVDMDQAVSKIRQSQRDSLAVAGLTNFGG